MKYKSEYADGNFEIYEADNDNIAFELAEELGEEYDHGIIFNIFEVNSDYDEIRTVH